MKSKIEALKKGVGFLFSKNNWYKTLTVLILIIVALNGFNCQTKYFTCSKTKIKLKSEGDKIKPFTPMPRPEAQK